MRYVDAIFLGKKKVRCDFDYDAMRLPSLLETFNLYKFVFCYCSSVLQSFTQVLFKWLLALP